jgi:hypothetical protein
MESAGRAGIGARAPGVAGEIGAGTGLGAGTGGAGTGVTGPGSGSSAGGSVA